VERPPMKAHCTFSHPAAKSCWRACRARAEGLFAHPQEWISFPSEHNSTFANIPDDALGSRHHDARPDAAEGQRLPRPAIAQ
jgi:hypothetical protein